MQLQSCCYRLLSPRACALDARGARVDDGSALKIVCVDFSPVGAPVAILKRGAAVSNVHTFSLATVTLRGPPICPIAKHPLLMTTTLGRHKLHSSHDPSARARLSDFRVFI
jgi:hypothetical protein